MPGPPLVYIIVLSWNGKDDTLECLKSLQQLTYPNVRVLLIDNASTDGTVATVRNAFADVGILVNPTNLRFAGGNNIGIKHALASSADYVLLLNNDTIVEPDFLTHLVRVAERESGVGMVSPKIYYFHQPQLIWFAGGKIEWWKGWISHIGIRENDRGQYDTIRETDYLTACCVLVKREVIERIGMLDERYFIYGEDADWCIRASRAGYKLLYVPSAVIWHKLSMSAGGHLSWFKNWNKLKSQLRLMGRYAKTYHWATIPFSLFINVVLSYFRVKRER
jgi:GT2 family glycosyltransferase